MRTPDHKHKPRLASGAMFSLLLGSAALVLLYASASFSSPSASYTFPTNEVPLALPAPSKDLHPCSQCHDASWKTNTKERPLKDMHDDISALYESKATLHPWCLTCHDAANRDMLRLSDGGLVPFSEAFRVCGQCHGEQFKRWANGLHGKHTGSWNGQKIVHLCGHCHSAHLPKFKAIKPLPPPDRPVAGEEKASAPGEQGKAGHKEK